MFIFGHIGVTVGAATIVSGLVMEIQRARKSRQLQSQAVPHSDNLENKKVKKFFLLSWFEELSNFLDVRILIIGSILPDIIDKPLGILLLGNGRTYTHTLLAALIVFGLGFYLYRRHKNKWLLTLNIGMFTHLILDQMWRTPHTLFWPLYGWTFSRGNETHIFSIWLSTLFHDPVVYISEGAGFLILISLLWWGIGKRRLLKFFLKGKI